MSSCNPYLIVAKVALYWQCKVRKRELQSAQLCSRYILNLNTVFDISSYVPPLSAHYASISFRLLAAFFFCNELWRYCVYSHVCLFACLFVVRLFQIINCSCCSDHIQQLHRNSSISYEHLKVAQNLHVHF